MSIADDARDPSSSSIGAACLFVGSLKACFLRTRIVTVNLCGAVFSLAASKRQHVANHSFQFCYDFAINDFAFSVRSLPFFRG